MGERSKSGDIISDDIGLFAAIRKGDRGPSLFRQLPEQLQIDLLVSEGFQAGSDTRFAKFIEAAGAKLAKKLANDGVLAELLRRWVVNQRLQVGDDPLAPFSAALARSRPHDRPMRWTDALIEAVHARDVRSEIPPELVAPLLRVIGSARDADVAAADLSAWRRWYRAAWCIAALRSTQAVAESDLASLVAAVDEAARSGAATFSRVNATLRVTHAKAARLEKAVFALASILREVAKLNVPLGAASRALLEASEFQRAEAASAFDVELTPLAETLEAIIKTAATPSNRLRLEALSNLLRRIKPRLSEKYASPFDHELDAVGVELARGAHAQPDAIAPLLCALERVLTPSLTEDHKSAGWTALEDLSYGFIRSLRSGVYVLTESSAPEQEPSGALPEIAAETTRVEQAEIDRSLASGPPARGTFASPSDGLGDEPAHCDAIPDIDEDLPEDPQTTQTIVQPPASTSSDSSIDQAERPLSSVGDEPPLIEGRDVDDVVPIPAPVLASRPTLPARARVLNADLSSFDRFREDFWIAPDGTLAMAPWRAPDHDANLCAAFSSELRRDEPSFTALWLISAGNSAPQPSTPLETDVEAFATLWSQRSVHAITPGERAALLQSAYEDSTIVPTLRWKLPLMLEALRPSETNPIPAANVTDLVAALEINDADLRAVIIALLRMGSVMEAPVERARALLGTLRGTDRVTTDPREVLQTRRRELAELFEQAQRKALFRFQTEFCQVTWHEFLREIQPEIQRLCLPNAGGAEIVDVEAARQLAATIEPRHAKRADRVGAKHHDRGKMDQAVKRIASKIGEIREAAASLAESGRLRAPSAAGATVPVDAFMHVLERKLERPEENFFCRLLGRLVLPTAEAASPSDPLAFTWSDILRCNALLEVMRPLRRVQEKDSSFIDLGRAPDIVDLRLAGAVLADSRPRPQISTLEELVDLLYRGRRIDALGALNAALDPSDQGRLRSLANDRQDLLSARVTKLRHEVRLLTDGASSMATALGRARDEVQRCIEGAADDGGPRPLQPVGGSLALLEQWVDRLLAVAEKELAITKIDLLREASDREDDLLARVEPLVEQDRLAEAIALTRGSVAGEAPFRRATAFRAHAQQLFHPRLLPPYWTKSGATHHQAQFSLRVEFSKSFLGEELHKEAYGREQISLPTERLRAWLDEQRLNPCFLAQIASRKRLIIRSVGIPTHHSAFVTNATNSVSENKNDLVVLLAPQITQERRDELSKQLRKQELMVGVIDDVDLFRLTNPGGDKPNGVLGLLEIVLEQQRWGSSAPMLAEGQHVQIEMYVGRKEEARRLATTPGYSRLFSGRKLGKSALLRFVERRYDGAELPSGLVLRVLYVSAVGIDGAGRLVDEIVDRLGARFPGLVLGPTRTDESAGDRLARATKAFIEKHPKESLLIVLDEADNFVESELVDYQQNQERCLSFVMRSRIEAERDSHDLSRVRFVFTGYRVTHTREGAWANWGDVLRLVPLPAADAAELAAGPLARIGIDASEQGWSIAHRAGYQPAVILRFTERLLARLDDMRPIAVRQRELTRVTAEDVAAVFENEAVQQEIRLVVQNNFQGNAAGGIVFGTLLGEFLVAGARAGLESAEEAIVRKLESLSDGDLSWLRPEGRSARDEVLRHLGDFVERQLVMEHHERGEPKTWYLRFPHHLLVIEPLARDERLREEIRLIRSREATGGRGARGLLSPYDISVLHDALQGSELEIVPVVGALMLPSDADRIIARGVFEKTLGLHRGQITDVSKREIDDARAVLGVSASELDSCLRHRLKAGKKPIITGGVDLLRAVLTKDERDIDGRSVMLEPIGFGRLTRAMVGWWFDAARGYHFADERDLDTLYAKTSGIPYLVGRLDNELEKHDPHGGGFEVTSPYVPQAAEAIDREIAALAEAFVRGDARLRLEPRERELLWMVAHLKGERDFLTDDNWSLVIEDPSPPRFGAYKDGSSDRVSLAVLERTGLVPIRADRPPGLPLERLAPVAPDDALHRLVRAMS